MLNWLNWNRILGQYFIHCKYYQCNINIGKYWLVQCICLHWNATIKKILALYWNHLHWNVTNVKILIYTEDVSNETRVLQKYWLYDGYIWSEMPLLKNIGFMLETFAMKRHYCKKNINFALMVFAMKRHYCRNIGFTLEIFTMKCQYCKILGLH